MTKEELKVATEIMVSVKVSAQRNNQELVKAKENG
jgi:hypothetical protein